MSDKIYKVPTGKVSRFIYNWREWGFKLAWSMLTKPEIWEPVKVESNERMKAFEELRELTADLNLEGENK